MTKSAEQIKIAKKKKKRKRENYLMGYLRDLMCGLMEEWFIRPNRRGLGQITDSILISSQLVKMFFSWYP